MRILQIRKYLRFLFCQDAEGNFPYIFSKPIPEPHPREERTTD